MSLLLLTRALPRAAAPRLGLRHYAKPPKPGTEHLRPKKTAKIPAVKPKQPHPPAPKATPPPPPKAAPAPPAPKPQSFTLESILASKPGPTLLYAHNPRGFVAGCYGLAALGLAWCGYTYSLDRDTAGLPRWVAKAHWAGIAMMMVVVGVVCWYPTRIVTKIYAVPRGPSVTLELHRRPLLPLLPPARITVPTPTQLELEKPFTEFAEGLRRERMVETREEGFVAGLVGAPGRGVRWLKRVIGSREFVGVRVVGGGGYVMHGMGWVWERRGLERLCGGGKRRYE